MRNRILGLIAIVALVIGAAVLVGPSPSEAVVITSVSVTVGSTTWCDTTGACANKIWNLGGGVNLNPGQSLILSQTSGFNFDTSEGNAPACSAATPCLTSITVNGSAILTNAANTNLANGNVDPNNTQHNEASNYVAAGGVGGSFNVSTGYFDNVHTNPCADADGNCQPDPASGPFVVGTTAPGFVETQPNHCNPATASCLDAGVILITAVSRVPEPSSLLLLGGGIMGIAAWVARRRRV